MVKRVLADDMPAITTYEAADAAPEATTFMGEKLPRCARYSGDSAMDHYIADRLKSTPMNFPAQTRFFVADVVSMVWMVGGFQPLEGGAPWYYSGTPGAENADAIIVPLCPFAEEHRDVALKALEGAGLELGQPIRDEVFWVYPVEGKGN